MSNIELLNEDCMTGMNQIHDKSVDMVFCDLPYGTTQNKWDTPLNLHELWKHYDRIVKDDGAIVLTAQTPFDKVLGASNIKMLKYEWIWKKTQATGFLNAKKMPMKEHENILLFYKKLPTYNPVLKNKPAQNIRTISTAGSKKSNNYGDYEQGNFRDIPADKSYPSSVLEFENQQGGFHPTEKPVKLIKYFISTYSNEGDLILDNCMGSGSTALACYNLNRKFIGFELNKDYYDAAVKRFNLVTSQTSLFKSA